jgi:hypothetical protein
MAWRRKMKREAAQKILLALPRLPNIIPSFGRQRRLLGVVAVAENGRLRPFDNSVDGRRIEGQSGAMSGGSVAA